MTKGSALKACVLINLVVGVACEGSHSPDYNVSRRLSECPCSVGQYRASCFTDCKNCFRGRFSPNTEGKCHACESGRFGNSSGQTECHNCSPGKVQSRTGATICHTCTEGMYAHSTGTSCHYCGRGSGVNAEQTGCHACAPGKWNPINDRERRGNCEECPAGRWNNESGMSEETCHACSIGKTSLPGSTQSADCVPCEAGRRGGTNWDTPVCYDCSPGRYSQTQGATDDCANCAAGKFQEADKATACESCPKGRYGMAPAEPQCTFQPCGRAIGAKECAECPRGTYSMQTGSTECVECPAGTYSIQTGSTECAECPAGTYNPWTGLWWDSPAYGQRPPAELCQYCPQGKASNAGAADCKPCAPGTYSAEENAADCKACAPGTYSAVQGAIICQACSGDMNTSLLPTGALACCPAYGNTFPKAGTLYTLPGERETGVHYLNSCDKNVVHKATTQVLVTEAGPVEAKDLQESVYLSTLTQENTVHECVAVTCQGNGTKNQHCLLTVQSATEAFSSGDILQVAAHVRTYDDATGQTRTDECPGKATLTMLSPSADVSGTVCAPDTLEILFIFLTGYFILVVV